MTSSDIRKKFLKFFEDRGHKVIPSASLIPENDPSVLFTTAGMQQFKSYYTNPELAEKYFGTKNIITIQKCIRTSDIDEVGDNTHLTFFEMLGNFSFGGYGRKGAIEYAYEFITKEMGLEISYVTVYEGSQNVSKDEESKKIWKSLGVTNIHEEGMKDLFWGPTGESGPCGPTTEIYCKNALGEDVEIWNIVFNEYFCDGSREKLDKGEAKLTRLPVLGIDTGMGLERLVTVVNKKESVYDTDIFDSVISLVPSFVTKSKRRIIVDHAKASTFLIAEGVIPANKEQGYVLRRLLRRIIIYVRGYEQGALFTLIGKIIDELNLTYNNLNRNSVFPVLKDEQDKFEKTLTMGLHEFEKGEDPFILFTSYGFPIELTLELAKEKGIKINIEDFNKKMAEHQKLSQTSSAGMFKGGLADHNEKTIKLHTAHHLLLAGLQEIVSKNIKQKGSNITEERLRMDFICDHKLTDEEKQKVEDWVNNKIKRNLNVVRREMPLAEAEKIGAQMEFGTKYPDIVTIYFVEDENGKPISKEFCGGPHIAKTSELGQFKIQKEEAVSQGVRRIKAILE